MLHAGRTRHVSIGLGFHGNVEVTGRRRMDALPAWRRIDSGRRAGKVASRWRSG